MDKDSHRKKLIISAVVFLVLFIPTIVAGVYYYGITNNVMTSAVITRRQTVASLSAAAVKLKLDHLVKITQEFAADESVKSFMASGQWKAAIDRAESLSNEVSFYDPYIDRVLLIDKKGMVRSAVPELYGGLGEEDVSISEWRSSLLSGGEEFHVSNVYKRRSDPRISIAEVLAPITQNNSVIGVVSLQIPVNNFSDFGKDVDIGSNGYAYFVDRLGQIISHPKFSSDGPIINYSNAPSVNSLLTGGAGVSTAFNPIERQYKLSAYEFVPVYGWGVISTEPVSDAFESRDGILINIVYLVAIISVIEMLAAFSIFIIQGSSWKLNSKI